MNILNGFYILFIIDLSYLQLIETKNYLSLNSIPDNKNNFR